MSLGLPTIVSATPEYLPLIKQGKNGFIAKSEKDWIKFIKFLRDNPEKRKEIENLQNDKLTEFLKNNPEKIDKIKETWQRCDLNNSQRRNKLRMLAAKWINNGNFNGLELTPQHLIQHTT
jgi:glycosyltransferase involved in cell wall biosynthesis